MAADNPNTSSMGLDPDLVERRSFDAGFRGFDQHQVRRYLGEVASELRAAAEREQAIIEREEALIEQLHIAEVRAEESAQQVAEFELGKLDDDRLSELVGAETTRVIAAAREASREILASAEEQRADLISNAEAEAESIRSSAEGLLAERHAEAEALASEILAAAEQQQAEAEAAAAQIQADAQAEAQSHIEDARNEGLRMIAEARVVREKVLRDMARRRNVGRQQVERLRAGRDRLLETYEFVRGSLDDVTAELEGVLPEAKLAADRAADRVDLDVVSTPAELEQDVADAYELGLVESAEIDAEAVRQNDQAEIGPEDESIEDTGSADSEIIDLTALEAAEGSEDDDDDDDQPKVEGQNSDSDLDETDGEDEGVVAGTLVPTSSTNQHDSAPMGLTGDAAASSRSRRRRELVDDVELPEVTDDSAFEGVRIIGPDPASRVKAATDGQSTDVESEPAVEGTTEGERASKRSGSDASRATKPEPESKPNPTKPNLTKPNPTKSSTTPAGRGKPVSRPVVTTPSERTPARPSQTSPGRTAEVLEFRGRSSRRSSPLAEPVSEEPDPADGDGGKSDQPAEYDAPVARVRSVDLVSSDSEDVDGKAETSEAGPGAKSDHKAQPPNSASGPTADLASEKATVPETDLTPLQAESEPAASELNKDVQAAATPGSSTVEDVLARLRSGATEEPGASGDKSATSDKALIDAESADEVVDQKVAKSPSKRSKAKNKTKAKDKSNAATGSPETPNKVVDKVVDKAGDSGLDEVGDETPGDGDDEFDDRPKPVDAGDPAIISSRDELTVPVAKDLARKLKRVLSDEQNELLTEIRARGAKKPLTAADVGAAEEMVDRYRGAAMEGLTAAAEAGATFFGDGSSRQSRDGVGDLASELADSIALPLHERLVLSLDAGDPDSVDARIRAGFREVRTSQITALVDHAVLAAFNRGRLTSLDSKTEVRWVFDTGSTSPCPDCHDNALAGGQPVGEAFPTGHAHPPIHPGCRCLVVPVKA